MTLQCIWTRYTTAPCPLSITDDEERIWRLEGQQWQDRQDEIRDICDRVGMDTDGWVPSEDFKATYRRYKNVKKDWINRGGAAGEWPFSGPAVEEGEESSHGIIGAFYRLFPPRKYS
jgi:hypothetical protein